MSTGNWLATLPPMAELVKRAGIEEAQTPAPVVGVMLGRVLPLVSDPTFPGLAQQAHKNIEATREVAIRGAAAYSMPYARELRANTVALSFREYLDTVKNLKGAIKALERQAQLAQSGKSPFSVTLDHAELARFVRHIYSSATHTPDFQGYLNYVCAVNPAYISCVQRIAPPILDERTREQHTYITGSSGSGKTELLKAFIYHDLRHKDASTVIIDPTGNLAGAVARWPEFAGHGAARLVYFRPNLEPGFIPCLNPLDAGHLNAEERSIYANQLTDVLSEMVGKGDWTAQTETVASACFQVLLNRKGSTLRHLRLAMGEADARRGKVPAEAMDLMEEGKRHPVDEVRDFFTYDFQSTQYATSKGSLRAKLGRVLRDSLFPGITGQPSTVRLEELVNAGKVIIFDLGAWGDGTAAGAFGRLVVAQLAAIGMRRATRHGETHTPVSIFVDEADLFVGRSVLNILSKLRQHRIFLTLAQQTPGYGYEGADKHQLFNNTAVKFAAGDGQREMLAMMRAPADGALAGR